MKIIFEIKHLIHLCLEIQNQFRTLYRCNYSEDSSPSSTDKKCILERKKLIFFRIKKINNHKIYKTQRPTWLFPDNVSGSTNAFIASS